MADQSALRAYEQIKDDPQAPAEGGRPGAAAPAAAAVVDVGEAAEPAPATGLFHVDWRRYYTKAFLSNAATFALMVAGVLMKALGVVRCTRWVLAAGVFGFAGGITNWLAVHMLFERVPGLYGSGVIPMRFVEIREAVKGAMMRCARARPAVRARAFRPRPMPRSAAAPRARLMPPPARRRGLRGAQDLLRLRVPRPLLENKARLARRGGGRAGAPGRAAAHALVARGREGGRGAARGPQGQAGGDHARDAGARAAAAWTRRGLRAL